MDTKILLKNAIAWAHEAGKIHLKHFRSTNINIEYKLNAADIVTIADKESETCILQHIKTTYPTHSILSEESGANITNSDYCWVIDPLDGTTNYSQGLPLFAVSIGIKYKGETIIGVVYAPYLDEMFYAVKGEGAFLNGNQISSSPKTELSQIVVATGFPVDKGTNKDNNLNNFSKIMPQVRGIRRLGAAALDLCYVANGILDAYWEMNLHEWDVCAGQLIAEESGALVTHFRFDRNISIISAPSSIHSQLLSIISNNDE